jgi:hypothetical protein
MAWNNITFTTDQEVDGFWFDNYTSGVIIAQGLYSDIGGAPGTLIVASDSFISIINNQYLPCSPVDVPAGNYWVGVNNAGGAYEVSNAATPQTWFASSISTPGVMPPNGLGASSLGSYTLGAWVDTCGQVISPTVTLTPTTTPTLTPTPAAVGISQWGMGFFGFSGGSGITNTPTGTLTPTPTQTPNPPSPTPVVPKVYMALGDSGTLAYCIPTPGYGFTDLTTIKLNTWYPNTVQANFGALGVDTQNYSAEIGVYIDSVGALNEGSCTRATIEIGLANLAEPPSYCDSCVNGASDAAAYTASFIFKMEIRTMILRIRAIYPGCDIVVCTIWDPNNNGLGPYTYIADQYVFQQFNARIVELSHYDNFKVADTYTNMMGHPEYYGTPCDNLHPTLPGYALIASLVEAQFANGY